MRIYCNGFNLYKKFKSNEPLIKKFEQFDFQDVNDLEVSLTYAVFKTKSNELFLTGGNSNEVQNIENDFGCISCVSCTNDNIFVLNAEGHLFQIEIVDLEKVIEVKTKEFLQPEDKLILCAIGDKINVGLTRFGYLYDFPRKLNFDVRSTVDIKVGGVHCLILDSQGNVYSFGNGR